MTQSERRWRLPRVALTTIAAAVSAAVLVAVGALAGSKPVVGDSMAPTLRDGDRILTDPFSSDPGRFDLVVARLDGSAESIKRVIGLPGDEVEIRVADGRETIRVRPAGHGAWHDLDPAAYAGRWGDVPPGCCLSDGTASPADTGPQVVPDGHYFLLGDNPQRSADSRRFGWIVEDSIVDVVRWRVWPPGDVGSPRGDVGFG